MCSVVAAMAGRTTCAAWIVSGVITLMLVAVGVMWPPPLHAQDGETCNVQVILGYTNLPPVNIQGSIDRVRIRLGAGPIAGGTKLTVDQVTFDLDCRDDSPAGTCVDDGAVAGYANNITSDCGVTWTANPVGNTVTFTASPPLDIPASQIACTLEFDIEKLASSSNDGTPTVIEQRATLTGTCDNGKSGSNTSTGSVTVEPDQSICVGVTGVMRSLPRR
jgi:hypothetical protein